MKLELTKKKLKNLSKDAQSLPADMTPQVAGGGPTTYQLTDAPACGWTDGRHACKEI
ncbi:hypothetical protein [Thalassomonas haliotis]|uniref:Natural product n=1 Tax=Thalassomonas haliotis TaxID=485448 RepID=A0ABY7VN35_9GAMM|nr:hypothetical protein [Thalassomonas haliotis]WDE14336.1 hypothetical protein H3N35_13470 [Thalassomonas haliotis]